MEMSSFFDCARASSFACNARNRDHGHEKEGASFAMTIVHLLLLDYRVTRFAENLRAGEQITERRKLELWTPLIKSSQTTATHNMKT